LFSAVPYPFALVGLSAGKVLTDIYRRRRRRHVIVYIIHISFITALPKKTDSFVERHSIRREEKYAKWFHHTTYNAKAPITFQVLFILSPFKPAKATSQYPKSKP
jgi:hypothetical protein